MLQPRFRTPLAALACGLLSGAALAAPAPQEKLLPIDGGFDLRYGNDVAIDGDTAVVGVPRDDDQGGDSGAAYVYRRIAGNWQFEQKLVSGDAVASNWFGVSVDIDQDTIVVGAYFDPTGGFINAGAAYVFTRSGSTWTEEQKLIPTDTGDLQWFGRSVAVDGDRAVIGAPFHGGPGNSRGAAYVFDRVGTTWNETQILASNDLGLGDFFGWSVDVEGNRAAVGAMFNDSVASEAGSAYVFVESGGSWSQEAKVTALDGGVDDNLGAAVSLDGTTLAVGSQQGPGATASSGATYVYTRSGSNWNESAKIFPADGLDGDLFGTALELDAGVLIVGAPSADGGGTDRGAAYRYEGSGAVWNLMDRTTLSLGDGDDLGVGVGVSNGVFILGARGDDDLGDGAGAAYVYDGSFAGITTYCTAQTNSQGCVPSIAGSGAPSASSASPFTLSATMVLNNKPGVFFYGINGRAAIPFNGGTLCAQPPLKRTPPQASGGNPPPDDCSGNYSIDFNALIQGGSDPNLVPGATVNGQYWSRDPASAGATNLTNAVEFSIGA